MLKQQFNVNYLSSFMVPFLNLNIQVLKSCITLAHLSYKTIEVEIL